MTDYSGAARPSKQEPLLSICIPTLNRAKLLRGAVVSCLEQTYANVEVVISDNASNDETSDVIGALDDKRIRYLPSAVRISMVENFRRAAEAAKGDYVCLLSSDDELRPTFAEWAVRSLEAVPEASFAFSGVTLSGRRVGDVVVDLSDRNSGEEFIRHSLERAQNLVRLCAAVCRRTLLREVGIEDLLFFDWTLWMRLAARGEVLYDPQVRAVYKSHAESETHRVASRESVHLRALCNAVVRFVESDEQCRVFRPEADRCLRRLHARYIDQMAKDARLSWLGFLQELSRTWHTPSPPGVKLSTSARGMAKRLRRSLVSSTGDNA